MRAAALAFCLLLPLTAFAADEKPLPHYVLVPEESKLKFVAIQNSAPVEGAFSKFSVDAHFSPKDLDHSVITAEVDVGSMFTAYPEVVKELVKPEWLDTAHFPKATLKTKTPIKSYPPRPNDDRGYYYCDADLTIRDKTVPVTINFVMERIDDEGAVAEGRMTIKRRDFDVGQGKWKDTSEVDDVVAISFRAVTKRVTP